MLILPATNTLTHTVKGDNPNRNSPTQPLPKYSNIMGIGQYLLNLIKFKYFFFSIHQSLPARLRIIFLWDRLTGGKKTKVLSYAQGGSIMKLKPKEMSKADSLQTFNAKRQWIFEELTGQRKSWELQLVRNSK